MTDDERAVAPAGGALDAAVRLPPRSLAADEVLLQVRVAALATGMSSSAPAAGTWVPDRRKPDNATWAAAAVLAVLALTAEQAVGDALGVQAREQVLVNGAAGVTGGLLVALALQRGADVIATAGPASQQRVSALGARHVIDCHDEDCPGHVRAMAGGRGMAAAVNAAPAGAASAISVVANGGRLATITSDPPGEQRGITGLTERPRPRPALWVTAGCSFPGGYCRTGKRSPIAARWARAPLI